MTGDVSPHNVAKIEAAAKALYEHVNSDWASQVATPSWEDSDDQEQYREFVRVVLDAFEGERD